jgi:hypothetical protein
MSDFRFDTSHIDWTHIQGGPDDGYPIDYSMAVLGYQEDNGTLDLLVRFAPNSHCHFHKHIAATTTLVLEGEHHVIEITDSGEQIHKVRPAGTYAHSPGGEAHMERGGPEGALVFFAMQEPTGHLFDLLDVDGNLIGNTTISELAAQGQQQAS